MGGHELNAGPPGTATAPPSERWGALAVFLAALFYLCVAGWLVLILAVGAFGFGLEPVVITSGSMRPLIRPGDVVLLHPAEDAASLGPGTVVTFEDPARPQVLTTHRITAINRDGTYRTRGDANSDVDSTPVAPDAIVGVARILVPLAGLPVIWLDHAVSLFVAWTAVTATASAVALRPPQDEREVPADMVPMPVETGAV